MWRGKFLGGSDAFYILLGLGMMLGAMYQLTDSPMCLHFVGFFDGAAIMQATARHYAQKFLRAQGATDGEPMTTPPPMTPNRRTEIEAVANDPRYDIMPSVRRSHDDPSR